MNRHFVSAAGAVLLAGVGVQAAAQTPPPPVITQPNWLKRPSIDDLIAVWPAKARVAGIDGRAVIGCEVTAEGTLRRCSVLEETPVGSGYGMAALSLAPQFQMSPKTVNGTPVAGGTVRIPITFRTGGGVSAASGSRTGLPPEGDNYVMRPNWTAAPARSQVAAAYPPKALAAGAGGRAHLDCGVNADGSMKGCKLLDQQPENGGFGRAAISLAPLFRLEPPRDASGETPRSLRVRIPVVFSPTVSGSEDRIAKPEWGALPTAEQVVYPPAAKAAKVEGTVMLDCGVAVGGTLTGCTVARETPPGMGFGESALGLAKYFRMKAWTSDGRPVDGTRARIPVHFRDPG